MPIEFMINWLLFLEILFSSLSIRGAVIQKIQVIRVLKRRGLTAASPLEPVVPMAVSRIIRGKINRKVRESATVFQRPIPRDLPSLGIVDEVNR